jgi:large subunit ribosomal protein L13
VKTYSAKAEDIERKWFVVDAEGLTLGRMATQIATILRGKHKPMFTPHVDCGDYVIVVNAEKINLTGKHMEELRYHHHSGYPGGLTSKTVAQMLSSNPERVVSEAVRRMLPKNNLGRDVLRKLKVYAGPEHPHEAQKPEKLEIETR